MVNRENYETFKQDFLGDHRADTAFNMQLFGNPNNDRLPENGTIKLNSLDNRTIAQGYVIANGIKTNLDNDSQTILQWIARPALCGIKPTARILPKPKYQFGESRKIGI